jgi:RimJ/RimL family protein N-acetyltransferase
MDTPENWLPPLSYTGGDLTLRVYSIEDVQQLQDATFESYEHLKPWMPWANDRQTLQQTERIVRRIIGGYFSNDDYTLGIWDGDTLVGGTGFHLRCGPIEWRCAEIGMWIRSSYAAQGWGTRALTEMLKWGFNEWGWQRLVWKCDTRNEGSIRVAEKCGLTREATFRSDALDVDGKRRDTHLYAILKSEWMTR